MSPPWVLLLASLGVASPARAAPLEAGERLTWAVRWMGVEAGRATATVGQDGDGWTVEVRAHNAGWLDALYPIDDAISSAFGASGSHVYRTQFREGRFVEDAEMHLAEPTIAVSRRRRVDGAWTESTSTSPWSSGVEDPLSAVFRLRSAPPTAAQPVRLAVFNGRRTLQVRAESQGSERVGEQDARVVRVSADREGDWEGRLTLYLSVDGDAVPLQAVLQTRAGPVTLVLVERVDPTP